MTIWTRLKQNNIFLIGSVGLVGFALHRYTMSDLDARTEQALIKLRLERQLKGGGAEKKGSDATKEALHKMLTDLPNKTTRQKLEDAVDAAHKTHGYGFRNSPTDPVDTPLPTAFTDCADDLPRANNNDGK
jgi:ethanolamine utilization microcompartment shell protein EutL